MDLVFELLPSEIAGVLPTIAVAVTLIVEFIKDTPKEKWGDKVVRPISFLVSLILVIAFANSMIVTGTPQEIFTSIVQVIISAMLVSTSSMGIHSVFKDPNATSVSADEHEEKIRQVIEDPQTEKLAQIMSLTEDGYGDNLD